MRTSLKLLTFGLLSTMLITGATSCSKTVKKQLPRDKEVNILLPENEGTISEYFSIITKPYELVIDDSLAVLDVTLDMKKIYPETDLFSGCVFSQDTTSFNPPEIILLNRDGYPVEGLTMALSDEQSEILTQMLKGPKLDSITVHFAGIVKPSLRDSIAKVSRNFRLMGRVIPMVKPEAIDAILKEYGRNVRNLNAQYTPTPPFSSTMTMEYFKILSDVIESENTAELSKNRMNPEQLDKFEKIKSSKRIPSWAK